jgi:amino acid transporter
MEQFFRSKSIYNNSKQFGGVFLKEEISNRFQLFFYHALILTCSILLPMVLIKDNDNFQILFGANYLFITIIFTLLVLALEQYFYQHIEKNTDKYRDKALPMVLVSILIFGLLFIILLISN